MRALEHQFRSAEPAPVGEDRREREQRLITVLNAQYFRTLKLVSLHWLAAASVPIWLQAWWPVLPNLIAWLALLVYGCCLGGVALYGATEHFWVRRAASERSSSPVRLHTLWTARSRLRATLWYGLDLASLPAWISIGLGRPLSAPLLSSLSALAVALLACLVAVMVLAREHEADRSGAVRVSASWTDEQPR
jgi:hypothetical protein